MSYIVLENQKLPVVLSSKIKIKADSLILSSELLINSFNSRFLEDLQIVNFKLFLLIQFHGILQESKIYFFFNLSIVCQFPFLLLLKRIYWLVVSVKKWVECCFSSVNFFGVWRAALTKNSDIRWLLFKLKLNFRKNNFELYYR